MSVPEANIAKVLHNIDVSIPPGGLTGVDVPAVAVADPPTGIPGSPPSEQEAVQAPDSTGEVNTAGAGARAPATVALSVAGAARGLGVAPGTLRSWERRYGLGPSMHTAGGHRRYGPVDLARLGVMHRLVQEGVPPAEAAAAAIRAEIDRAAVDAASPYSALLGSSAGVVDTTEGPQGGQEARADQAGNAEGAEPGSSAPAGGGRVLPTPDQPRSVRGLARAAMALDTVSCHRIMMESLRERGALATWDELVRPVLVAIGQRWAQTARGVEVEHSFSRVLIGVLAAHSAQLTHPRNGRPALLASVPDELHDLPLAVLQAALSDLGIRSHVLGARTPTAALNDAVVRLGPPVIFLWAQMAGPSAPELPSVRPAPLLLVGGPGWTDVPEGAHRVTDLGEAVGAVRTAMGL